MATTAPRDVPVRNLQDILTALDQHPEWRTALRQRLLGEELLELPALFAKFARETTRRLDMLTQDVASLKGDVASLKGDVASLKGDVASLKGDFGSLKGDVAILKGGYAEAEARADIAVIADELDLEYRRTVPRVELRRLARNHGADLEDDQVKSFLASDIIAETNDAQGATTYLSVEASFTGDMHDADRARGHAALMERLTGNRCRAVVASARNNDRLIRAIERREVAWHPLRVRIQAAS